MRELEQLLRHHKVRLWPDKLNAIRNDTRGDEEELNRQVARLYEGTMGSLPCQGEAGSGSRNGDSVNQQGLYPAYRLHFTSSNARSSPPATVGEPAARYRAILLKNAMIATVKTVPPMISETRTSSQPSSPRTFIRS